MKNIIHTILFGIFLYIVSLLLITRLFMNDDIDNHHVTFTNTYINKKIEMHSGNSETNEIFYNEKFAIFSCATPKLLEGYSYVFYLPLTVLAWKRIGYRSLIVITGDSKRSWYQNPILNLVRKQLESQEVLIVFIEHSDQMMNPVFLSQFIRLFGAYIIEWPYPDHTVLCTTDTDLWPLDREHYMYGNKLGNIKQGPNSVSLINKNDNMAPVIVSNYLCCGDFVHNRQPYRMYPLSSIISPLSTWKQLVNISRKTTFNVNKIKSLIHEKFPKLNVSSRTIRGNEAWYFDQTFISIHLKHWQETCGGDIIGRSIQGRIDRAIFIVPTTLEGITDTHLPFNGYKDEIWNEIHKLLELMFPGRNNLELLHDQQKYRDTFNNLINKQKP